MASDPSAPLVVFLDAHSLGDPLFIPGLARDLAARPGGLVLVHGSGERGERALESLGLVPTASDGVWAVDGDRQRGAVERATRELNREIVHELNEQNVSAVGVMASGRGLARLTEAGDLALGRVEWVSTLARQGVTVVMAARASSPNGDAEADAAGLAGALAGEIGGGVFALSQRSVPADAVPGDLDGLVADADAVRRLAARTGQVHLGLRAILRSGSDAGFALSIA